MDQLTNVEALQFADGVYANHSFVAATVRDADDAFAWESYTDTFNTNGDQIDRVFVCDDGSTDTFLF